MILEKERKLNYDEYHMVQPQIQEVSGQTVEKTPVITPKKAELVTEKFQTPETKKAEAKISQQTFDTLAEAITFNIDIANQMTSVDSASFLGKFIDTFKANYPGIDLKNPDQVKEKADEFLKTGGGKPILASLKLLEMQGTLLSAGGRIYFKELKKATPGKEPKVKKVFKVGKDGLTIIREPEIVKQKFLFFSWDAKQTAVPPVSGEYVMEMNDNFTYGTQITDAQEKEYLQKCGFVDGLDLKNDPQVQELLITRLAKIAQARTELFLETGKNFTQVDLNFVDAAGNYLNTRNPHFIGEVGTSLKAEDLANEGVKIADEIKLEVQKKIKEKIEAAQKSKLEGTATQLRAKIEQIKNNAKLAPEEKIKRIAEAQKEIDRLTKELKLFERQKDLPEEIEEAEKAREEAADKIKDRQSHIPSPAGESNADLLKWAGNISEQESCISIKARLDGFIHQQELIQKEIDRLQTSIEWERGNRPEVVMESLTAINPSTGQPERKEFPNADYMASKKQWEDIINDIRVRKNKKSKQLDEDVWLGQTKPLSQLISELQAQYDRRKTIIDDPDTKQLIDSYRNKEKVLTDKNAEKINVNAKITALKKVKKTVAAALKKANEKQERINSDKLDADDERETEALEGFTTLFTGDTKQTMEQRIQEKEEAIASGTSLILEWGPEFDGYPKALLETVRIMFGEEVISAYPSAEKQNLVKQTLALLSSGQYIEIIIDEIEKADSSFVSTDKVGPLVPAGAVKNVEIKKTDLHTKTGGKPIESIDLNKIDKSIIEKIISRIRVQALGVKSL